LVRRVRAAGIGVDDCRQRGVDLCPVNAHQNSMKTFFSRANVKKYQITLRKSGKVKESVARHCANARPGALFACGML
ncbi:hypothetical protein, partial [Burkholderia sp. KCJ3K979]|uniref:hypothetical protein n=1 Tax=Burkholderia sp. KCJ3K979 TaxID=2759149 RepID=UPI001F29B304